MDLANFQGLNKKAMEHLKKINKMTSENIKKRKYEYDINSSIALAYMKNRFMKALLNLNITAKIFCLEIKKLMKQNLELIRPDRQFKHHCKYPNKRFPTNT